MNPEITARLIGRERQPLVVVDGFFPDPDALRAAATAIDFGPAGEHYPGIRAALPPDYLKTQRTVLATVLREVFGIDGAARVIDASFSIVTASPATLTLEQRLPHVDAVDAGRIALVHYLAFDGDGTAFFRHRATGFETIDAVRAPIYFANLDAELRAAPPPLAYITADTPLFERIAHIDARYNRALIYRSASLHSGAIAPDAVLASDPAHGRLTVTAFIAAA